MLKDREGHISEGEGKKEGTRQCRGFNADVARDVSVRGKVR